MIFLRRSMILAKKNPVWYRSFNQFNFSTTTSDNKHNYFQFGFKMIPRPDKAHRGGEDAIYSDKNILCVADAAGGGGDMAINPGLYSKALCENVGEYIKTKWDFYKTNPKQLIIDAAGKTRKRGTSTICLAILDDKRPFLHTVYVGDSVYMLFRKDQTGLSTVVRSKEQEKEFNHPYQIGSYGDPPEVALTHQYEIKHNDIVVLGTDGLVHNLEDQQIADIIKSRLNQNSDMPDTSLAAEQIADLAYKHSLDPNYESPFVKRAKEISYNFEGGRSDDITVIVGQIKLIENK